jgi:gliding motility-associated-like protein
MVCHSAISSKRWFSRWALPWCALTVLLQVVGITDLSGQSCVVINEIMINPDGPCDGSCVPNTEEWVELYNTCDLPVDLGCFVIGDGDYAVTIPSGTTLSPGQYLVIGSTNSGIGVDVNVGTCNCANGSGIGILSNTSEQLVLINPSGVIQDAVYWGTGQFPVNIVSGGGPGCVAVSAFAPAPNAQFEVLPTGGGQNCTVARVCDGAPVWEERCNGGTMGDTNGEEPEVSFSSSGVNLCPGDCISYTGSSTLPASAWSWCFEGATTGSSSVQNPSSICYPTSGSYDVTLSVTTACGEYEISESEFISVNLLAAPVIVPDGPLVLCSGDDVILSVYSAYTSYQWYFGNAELPGETAYSLLVTQTGSYHVMVGQGSCALNSAPVAVEVVSNVQPVITPNGSTTLCEGDQVLLQASAGLQNYVWYLNGVILPGENSSALIASDDGIYTVSAGSGNCAELSSGVLVSYNDSPEAEIIADGDLIQCGNTPVLLSVAPGQGGYQWFRNGQALPGAQSAEFLVIITGNYSVEVQDGPCSLTSEVVSVEMFPFPNPEITAPFGLVLCEGVSPLLNSSGTGSFQWFLNNQSITGAVFPGYAPESPGSYTVSLTDSNGCTSTAQSVVVQEIQLSNPVVFNSSGPDGVCEGEPVTVQAEGVWLGYVWELSGGVIFESPTVQVSNDTEGTLVVTTQEGCTAQTDWSVAFLPAPVPVISATGPYTVCSGEEVTLSCGIWSGYQWMQGGAPLTGGNTASFAAGQSGQFGVIVTGTNGCSGAAIPVQVTVLPVLQTAIQSTSLLPCEGELVTLYLNETFPVVQWSTGQTGLSIVASQTGEYSVTVTDQWNCSAQDELMLNFAETPLADAGPDLVNDCSGGMMVGAQTGPGDVLWIPGEGLDDPQTANPWANPALTTTYFLTVSNGVCVGRDTLVIEADCVSFFAPNAFTPDNDGYNDVFRIITRGVTEFNLQIFDRWGGLVYESGDPEGVWTGSSAGRSTYVPDGAYAWKCKVRYYGSIEEKLRSGHVILLR